MRKQASRRNQASRRKQASRSGKASRCEQTDEARPLPNFCEKGRGLGCMCSVP